MQLFHFWSRDVHTVQNLKICCGVQNFMKIGLFLTEIWRYIDFQNCCRPPSWNCFTTIRDHPRSLLLAAAACQISCQSDTQIWRYSYLNFSHIWLEMPIQAPKMRFLGDFGPLNVIIHHRYPQKAHPCVNPRLFKLSTVKIRRGVWPVGELTESVTDTHTQTQVNLYFVYA